VITSGSNPKLQLVRKLERRKYRDELGLFACEGEDLVAAGGEAGRAPVELRGAGEDLLAELRAAVAALPHPARTIGVFRRDDLPRGEREACLALWHVADPGNVGTLLRAADAFGAAVALSSGCADPLGGKALRASAGAVFRVPLLGFDEAPGRRIALVAHGGRPLAAVDLAGPVAFVLGAEREGLPQDVLAACAETATIPTPGPAESLNVAVAGALALYERSRRS
jgi:TrmH family RNA methyltransferase